jgi:hypothetical protein
MKTNNQLKTLDSVSKAKQRYVIAKTTLEQRLRDQLKQELSNLQTQIDIAVRFAFESGASKADILRSLGTKDYHTVYESLARTQDVQSVEGVSPLDSVYLYNWLDEVLTVTYSSHGPSNITGTAKFDVRNMDDGTTWLIAQDPLWNEDFTIKNEVVAALDNKQDGYYYEEATGWLGEQV